MNKNNDKLAKYVADIKSKFGGNLAANRIGYA